MRDRCNDIVVGFVGFRNCYQEVPVVVADDDADAADDDAVDAADIVAVVAVDVAAGVDGVDVAAVVEIVVAGTADVDSVDAGGWHVRLVDTARPLLTLMLELASRQPRVCHFALN